MGLFDWLFGEQKKKLLNRMSNLVDLVKMGLYKRLKFKFSKGYEEGFSGLLAAAVVNELFSDEPSADKARKFKKENKEKILEEILKLRDDHQLRRILTDAIRVRSVVRHGENSNLESGLRNKLCLDPILKLDELGILIPGGDAPQPAEFEAIVNEFLLSSESILND